MHTPDIIYFQYICPLQIYTHKVVFTLYYIRTNNYVLLSISKDMLCKDVVVDLDDFRQQVAIIVKVKVKVRQMEKNIDVP